MPFISRLQPPLTSVRVPQYELGVEAARLLLDRLSGRTVTPRVVLLPVRLVVRGSTAPPGVHATGPRTADQPPAPMTVAGSMPRSVSSDAGGVPPGPAGDRAARVRGGAGLVEPLDRQPVRRPADEHLPRRQPELPAVAGAADVVPVARLEVDRRLSAHGQHVLGPQPGHPLRRPLDDLRGEAVALGVPRTRARSRGAKVSSFDTPCPPGARSGSTTVEQTMSTHGSTAYVSPRAKASSWAYRPAAEPIPPATAATGPVRVS